MFSSPLPLPITLTITSVLALLALVIAFRVSLARLRHKVSVGDGGNPEVAARMRAHANFIEYVPLILILMGMIEFVKASKLILLVCGILLVIFRIMHAIGMERPAPNVFRAGGAGGTMLLLLIFALWGLIVVFTA